jgi:hypothetical protein
VSTDDLQEKIEAFEELVQSVDIAVFSKIWVGMQWTKLKQTQLEEEARYAYL